MLQFYFPFTNFVFFIIFLGVLKCFFLAKVFMMRTSHPMSPAENQRSHNLIHSSIQSGNQYISCTAGSAETICRYKVSQTAETCIRHLDMGEIIESGSKPQEVEPVPGVMHLSAVGSPLTDIPPSWQRPIKITLIYLCMLPGTTCERKKYIPGNKKKKTDRQTSYGTWWHWVSGQRKLIWELHSVTE